MPRTNVTFTDSVDLGLLGEHDVEVKASAYIPTRPAADDKTNVELKSVILTGPKFKSLDLLTIIDQSHFAWLEDTAVEVAAEQLAADYPEDE